MIEVGEGTALTVVGGAALMAAVWGVYLSTRSSSEGPAWALGHLRRTPPWFLAAAVAGAAVTALIRPVWMGVAVLYVVAVVWWIAAALRRSLSRVDADGGLAAVPGAARRGEILRRARRLFLAGAIVLAALAALDASSGGRVAPFALGLAALLGVAGLLLRPGGPAE